MSYNIRAIISSSIYTYIIKAIKKDKHLKWMFQIHFKGLCFQMQVNYRLYVNKTLENSILFYREHGRHHFIVN
jgi:hypothetical protein